MKAKKKRKN